MIPALDYVSDNKMLLLFLGEVTKVGRNAFKRKKTKILLITDEIIGFYHSNFNPRFWITITALNYNKGVITLSFDKKIICFETEKQKSKQIYSIILDLLQRELIPSELDKIGFKKKRAFLSKPTERSFYARISQLCKIQNTSFSAEESQTIKCEVLYRRKVIDFQVLPEPDVTLPILLNSIPLSEYIQSLQLMPVKTNPYETMRKYPDAIKKLYHLHFHSKADQHYISLMNQILKLNDTNLSGLTFSDSEFNESHLELLFKITVAKKLRSLGFYSNSVDCNAYQYLYTKFLPNISSTRLQILRFDHCKDLDLNNIIKFISSINVLSLRDCGFEIADILEKICSNDFKRMNELDISSNHCTKPIDIKLKLPVNLVNLVINKVEWTGNNLELMFKLIFSHLPATEFRLSLSKAHNTEKTSWINFFSSLRSYNTCDQLVSLSWNANPVNEEFFNFLKRCRNLKTLSICKYFSNLAQNNQIPSLCEYLPKAKSLTSLIIRGYGSVAIRDSIFDVLHAVRKMASIKHLDISNNSIGDNGVALVTRMLRKKSLQTVILDGSGIQTTTVLIDLAYAVRNTRVSFPVNDVNFLYSANVINEDLCDAWKIMSPENEPNIDKVSEFQRPENSPFDEKYSFYTANIDTNIKLPQYLVSDYISRTRRQGFRHFSDSQTVSRFSSDSDGEPRKLTRNASCVENPQPRRKKKTKSNSSESDNGEAGFPIKKKNIGLFGDDDFGKSVNSKLALLRRRTLSHLWTRNNRFSFGQDECQELQALRNKYNKQEQESNETPASELHHGQFFDFDNDDCDLLQPSIHVDDMEEDQIDLAPRSPMPQSTLTFTQSQKTSTKSNKYPIPLPVKVKNSLSEEESEDSFDSLNDSEEVQAKPTKTFSLNFVPPTPDD